MHLAGSLAKGGVAAGLTLVELMITLAILTVLTLIAVPGMSDLLSDARLSAQTDLFVSTLNSARLEAVKQRKNMTVCPATDPDSNTACATNASDWATGFMVSDGASMIQRIQSKRGVTITTAATSVVFSGTLGSAVAASSFTFCAPGRKQHQVDVALSGHVSKRINSSDCT